MNFATIPGVGGAVTTMLKHSDNRGSVSVPFKREELREFLASAGYGFSDRFDHGIQQQTISKSRKGTVRGIHFSPYPKLITCLDGTIVDYVVHATNHNKDRGHVVCAEGIRLDSEYPAAVFVPAGVGHGFVSLTDSIVSYLSWGEWSPNAEVDVNVMTPELRWITQEHTGLMLHMSDKDREAPTFSKLSDESWAKIHSYDFLDLR